MKLTQPLFVLPDWPGTPAQQILGTQLQSRSLPSTPSTLAYITGDTLVGLSADDKSSRALGETLSLDWKDLSEGDFAILPRPNEKRVIVLGGDKRGLLFGLADLLQRARVAKNSIALADDEVWERSALPRNYYWTWDHSTNWWLQAEGQQEIGCNNIYTKTADDFVRDYTLLIDHCVRSRVAGIAIYGFCRDAHGGVAASQAICHYAADRGIRIMPGVGTCLYGGVYYVSDQELDTSSHPLTAKSFVRSTPAAGLTEKDGKPSTLYPCPSHPATRAWLKECAAWLCGNFRIGGVNVEHGDFFVCHCDRCAASRQGQRQATYFSTMELANNPFMDELQRLQPDAWVMYATYTGFAPDPTPERGFELEKSWQANASWRIHGANPEFITAFDDRAICQWTLTHLLNDTQIPLATWLDDGKPAAMLRSEHWAEDVKPPTKHSVGFVHQGSQWDARGAYPVGLRGRYSIQISCFKEACLRAARAGLEGVSIHGEVSSRCVPYALNYLAHKYFSYHPEASLREFGRQAIGPVLGGEPEGEQFVEWMARAEAGTCSKAEREEIDKRLDRALTATANQGAPITPARYWTWLRVAAEPGQWAAAQVYQLGS